MVDLVEVQVAEQSQSDVNPRSAKTGALETGRQHGLDFVPHGCDREVVDTVVRDSATNGNVDMVQPLDE